MGAIQTAASRFQWATTEDRLEFVRQSMIGHGHDPRLLPPITEVATEAPPAVAWVDHGRWLAACPDPNCRAPGPTGAPGIEYVQPGEPFFCCACANVGVGHRWRLVGWPRNRAEIERLLAARPYPHQRTWLPGEPVERLEHENAAIAAAGAAP